MKEKKKRGKEKFFWADQIADIIIKKSGKKKEYVCASGISPSGEVHIGNFREVITTDMVVRALKDKGKKTRFIYSWDDFDRFRKIPVGVDKSFEKYLGMPISEVPSPDSSEKFSYAEHFEKKFEKSLEKVGVKPEYIRQSIMGKKCAYADLIKKGVENKEKIIEILNKYRKEPLKKDWLPLIVYCEKCRKDFTKILSVKNYEIEYECKCGHKDKIDFRKKGLVKAPWRVDWPLRWKYEGVIFEPGGADHSAAGGSFDTGKKIAEEVFDYPAPMYYMYEWITVKGTRLKDFHSSTGNVTTLDQVEEIYEPEVLRYLFVGTRPNKAFQISFDLDVIKIYEDYDALERKYYSGKADSREKRQYEVCQLKLSKKQPERKSFRQLVSLIQINKLKGLNKESLKRAEKVKNWLKKYAPKEMSFDVQEKVKVKLNGLDKKAMIELRKSLEAKKFNEENLYQEFYDISKKVGIETKQFFKNVYMVLINKEKGPRLAGFIVDLGQDKVIKLLKQIN